MQLNISNTKRIFKFLMRGDKRLRYSVITRHLSQKLLQKIRREYSYNTIYYANAQILRKSDDGDPLPAIRFCWVAELHPGISCIVDVTVEKGLKAMLRQSQPTEMRRKPPCTGAGSPPAPGRQTKPQFNNYRLSSQGHLQKRHIPKEYFLQKKVIKGIKLKWRLTRIRKLRLKRQASLKCYRMQVPVQHRLEQQ